MDRRRFLHRRLPAPRSALANRARSESRFRRRTFTRRYPALLVLIELKGGNDGSQHAGAVRRPCLLRAASEARDRSRRRRAALAASPGCTLRLRRSSRFWDSRELAILQGVGYPDPNLSHFRSIEIWDTASASELYLQDGWLTRTFAADRTAARVRRRRRHHRLERPRAARRFGHAHGSAREHRSVPAARATRASPGDAHKPALEHILKVEADIVQAASHLDARYTFGTEFPRAAFGNAIHTACQVLANPAGVAVVRITLSGFDTPWRQAATHARPPRRARARESSRSRRRSLELGRWDDTLVLTYAEFGRDRARTCRTAPTTERRACISPGEPRRGASTARRRGSIGFGRRQPALRARSSAASTRRCSSGGGVLSSSIIGGKFAPVPFVKT
jgi:uncharacterized protein (DUF1501 family)